jgi:hypothetical protein
MITKEVSLGAKGRIKAPASIAIGVFGFARQALISVMEVIN